MESEEETPNGKEIPPSDPPNPAECVDESSGSEMDCEDLGDRHSPSDPIEQHESTFNEKEEANDSAKQHEVNHNKEEENVCGIEGISIPGVGNHEQSSSDRIVVHDSSGSDNLEHEIAGDGEEGGGYEIFVESILSNMAELGNSQDDNPNIRELGQPGGLSSDCKEDDPELNVLCSKIRLPCTGFPVELNIPRMGDVGHKILKHGTSKEDSVKETSLREEAALISPRSADSGEGVAQRRPPIDDDDTNTRNGATPGLNDLGQSGTTLDIDDDETPSESGPLQTAFNHSTRPPNKVHQKHRSGCKTQCRNVKPNHPSISRLSAERKRSNGTSADKVEQNSASDKYGHVPHDHNRLDSSVDVNIAYAPSKWYAVPYFGLDGNETMKKRQIETKIQLPVPRNLRGYRWLAESVQRFKLGASCYSYEGGISKGSMHGLGRLIIGDEGQFVEGYWSMNRLADLRFCQFTLPGSKKTIFIVKRLEDYLLTIHETRYVASATVNSVDELDLTASAQSFKKSFLTKITILKILEDELNYKREASLNKFKSVLQRLLDEDANPVVRATIWILLGKCLRYTNFNLSDLLDRNTPDELQDAVNSLHTSERRYVNTTSIFFNSPQSSPLPLRQIVSNMFNDSIMKHKQALISKCPSALPRLASEIQKLDRDKIVYIAQGDIAVFEHIVSQPCFEHYKGFFENLVERYCLTIQTLGSHTPPSDVIPLMPSVYGFLVKSFWETISEIVEAADYNPEDMLKYESGNWNIEDDLKLPEEESGEPGNRGVFKFFMSSERKSSLHLRSLVIQYKTLFQIMKRFSPGNHINGRKCDFKFSILEQELSVGQRGMKMVGQSVGLDKRLEKLSPERVAWLYLLDHTIHNALKDEPNYKILLKSYSSLLDGHISFIEKSPTESHEKFRVMTRNTVKFIILTVPYFGDSRGKPGIDVNILVQQIWTLSNASRDIEHDHLAFSNSRDLLAEYNRYLSLRLSIDIEAAPGYFSSQITEMMETLMRIVADSLKKSVPTAVLVGYLRSLNDFLDDFKNIDFLGIWYVKSWFYDPKLMEKIDNKLVESAKCSYRVTDIENYVADKFQPFGHQPPEHYILQIVTKLLECIETCLSKRWTSDQLQVAQLESTSVLLDAVRQSFMYLKEQPDYLDFETFKKESVDPFARLVSECSDTETLKKRANTVKESFWYIRKMDEISIDQAVAMFNKANTSPDSDKILSCYDSYIRRYEEYVAEYRCSIASGKTHSEGLDAVRQMLDLPAEPLHYSEWTEEFKTYQIPTILAGLSAVWSILVSEDVSSTGKFLKPHCIQVLCVMRLLGVDSPEVANHITQVLTGQGKSVILALLSSTLALTGHEVRVLCYSSYLSSRDQNDFKDLFQKFHVAEKIHYGTFEHMAHSLLNPTRNGIETSLRDLVKEKVLNHTDWSSLASVTTESKKMVLLIDEVDVFFTKDFYGNTYEAGTTLAFRGLERVQEHIWTLPLSNTYSENQIEQHSEKLIADEVAVGKSSMIEFKSFLDKPGTFSLLVHQGQEFFTKQYSNQSLFSEHLLLMIRDALHVRNRNTDEDFRLNSEGVICSRRPDNIYSPNWLIGYCNTFNYFKLKGSDYDSKNSQNYGYLNLSTGSISYARLPSQFSLILGVSGTVANLGRYERSGLESYGINKRSILPTFFGDSNLKFNQGEDFHYSSDAQDWLKKIYSRANQMVLLGRAVLIFFESDAMMNAFSKEYKSKFYRLNEITVNTEARVRDVYIEEAGLPCAVTLATRDMGRGVDYKSSLSVEKNGGVHVIQTFLSTDVKEEVQIKGRTARKDNRGSYEMVICRQHLVRNNVISSCDAQNHSYASLDEIRQQMSEKEGQTVAEKIQKCEGQHITTMKYFGLM